LPELPEVETMVRGIRDHVLKRPIKSMIACPNDCKSISLTPSLAVIRRKVVGRTFLAARRLGKRIVFEISDGSHLVIEPRMTGLMLLSDPPDVEHLRLRWDFDGPGQYRSLWFWDRRGLGTVTWFPSGSLEAKYNSRSIGPDALEMTPADWQQRCQATGREIKVVLLDQKVVAGIGNLYASEILHQAAINPTAAANRLSRAALEKLAAAVKSVLQRAVECEGSTLGDGTYRNALNKNGNYQNHHRAYMREGETCLTCRKNPILRIVQAQRSTFFCPHCQTK
jgi:formamidopyrimidine-DNA glycosylase